MADVTKLKMKIGSAEFEADGPSDVVQEQFRQFMDAVNALPSTKQKPPDSSGFGIDFANFGKFSPKQDVRQPDGGGAADASTDSRKLEELRQVFDLDGDVVSLRLLPPPGETRPGDAFILILYGHRMLRGEQQVSTTLLAQGMRISGIPVTRVDRGVADRVVQYIIRGGVKKGTRYALNNPGVVRAQELIRPLQGEVES